MSSERDFLCEAIFRLNDQALVIEFAEEALLETLGSLGDKDVSFSQKEGSLEITVLNVVIEVSKWDWEQHGLFAVAPRAFREAIDKLIEKIQDLPTKAALKRTLEALDRMDTAQFDYWVINNPY